MYVERANTMKAIEQNHCRWQFPSICQDGKEHTQVWVWKWAGTDKDRGSRLVLVLQQAADNKWQRCQLRSTYHLPPAPRPLVPPGHPATSWTQSFAVDVAGASCAAGQRHSAHLRSVRDEISWLMDVPVSHARSAASAPEKTLVALNRSQLPF